jgi:flagellar motor switch protein FliM
MAVSESSEQQAPAEGTERARALDFSQPTRFTPDLGHRITHAIQSFCEAVSARLTAELHVQVEVSISDVSQHTWAAARSRLPADSVAIAIRQGDPQGEALLSIERPLLLQALECLLGGSATQAPEQRHLSDIDWAVSGSLLDAIVAELSLAWTELGAPPLMRGEPDTEGDGGVAIAAGEPTFVATMQSVLDGEVSAFSLLLPWSAVEPIAERILGSDEQEAPDPHGSEALRRGVSAAQVLLRAEVGSVQMPIGGLLELGPETLLSLQERAEDGVRLFAEGLSIGRGRPGRSGRRRAIKLESTGEHPEAAHTYATLGRPELERARAQASGSSREGEGAAVLDSIFVRIWAELGRTHVPLGRALELAPGEVLELDQPADAPVELFANGLCFASGSLVVTPDGEWGVQISALV